MDGDGCGYGFTLMVCGGPLQPPPFVGVTVMVPPENTPGIVAVTPDPTGLLKVIPPVEVQL